MAVNDEEFQIDPLVLALTRPTMMAGVPRGAVVFEIVLVAMIFLNTKNLLVWFILPLIHIIFYVITIRDPFYLHILITKFRKCPKSQNTRFWGGASYGP